MRATLRGADMVMRARMDAFRAVKEAKAKEVIRVAVEAKTEEVIPVAEEIPAAKEVRCVVCKFCVAKGEESWSPASCKICVVKASALKRIEAAGGDNVKAAEDSELRARGEVCVLKAIPTKKFEEGVVKPVGVVKSTIKVPEAYLRSLLIDPELMPLLPLAKDYFQRNPHHRELMLNSAFAVLSTIEQHENMLVQFFEKGYAMMEVQVDYGH